MADLKISQLTGATTPLTGAETLPVVQSNTTKQVSIANLTLGRAVSTGNLTTTGTSAFTVNTVNTAGLTGTNSSNSAYFTLGVSGATGFGVANWANSTVFESVPASGGGLVIGSFSGNVNFQVARFTYASLSSTALTFTAINLTQGTAGKGINFTANTAAAGMTSRLLNWYEEGTWTPTDGSGAGLTFTVSFAKYTRIGRQVSFTASITYPTTASGASAAITGFPFTAIDAVFGRINYTSASTAVVNYLNGNTTTLFLLIPGVNTTNAQMTGATLNFSGTYFV